jgi:hypothetical protein
MTITELRVLAQLVIARTPLTPAEECWFSDLVNREMTMLEAQIKEAEVVPASSVPDEPTI